MILFVCTGNTCRSPMAAALARHAGIDARSAGLFPMENAPAAGGAVRAMAARGIDLTGHRARRVTGEDAEGAARIFAMEEGHRAMLESMYPACRGKVSVLLIPDPYGGDDRVYRACADAIERALREAGVL